MWSCPLILLINKAGPGIKPLTAANAEQSCTWTVRELKLEMNSCCLFSFWRPRFSVISSWYKNSCQVTITKDGLCNSRWWNWRDTADSSFTVTVSSPGGFVKQEMRAERQHVVFCSRSASERWWESVQETCMTTSLLERHKVSVQLI